VAFEIVTKEGGTPSAPLLRLDVQDRLRAFTHRVVSAGALESRDGGVWASVEFEVTADTPTENMDVCVWTFGTSPFAIKDMEIRRMR
jgi:hypothetical protein